MMPLSAAFVIGNRTVWEQAHACIQNLPVRLAVEQSAALTSGPEGDELLDRIERHRVDVVLVETSLIPIPLDEFVRRLRNTASQPAVFVLNPDASPELILEALRAGANEYLYPPLADALRDALQRLSAVRSKSGSETSKALGKVFAFLSARGGCGGTTVAAHVALEIARQTKQPTLIADFDFEAGILRFLMKAKNSYTVRDAVENLHRMDASLWNALVSSTPEHLDVIPTSDEIAGKRAPEREEMMHLLRFIRSTYGFAIADFGRSISPALLNSLPEIETVFLVTTPDESSLERTKQTIASIESRGFAAERIQVALNRAGEKKTNIEAVARVLGRQPERIFHDDRLSLYDAYSEGRFLPPSTGLAREFRALADAIRTGALERQAPRTGDGKPAGKGIFPFRGFSFLQRGAAKSKPQPAGA
jgi:pilus assembly protein CpaE